jgi:hypothetical protein
VGVPAREAPYLTLGHFFQDKLQTVNMLHNVQQSNVSVKRLGAASFPPWGDCSIIEYTIHCSILLSYLRTKVSSKIEMLACTKVQYVYTCTSEGTFVRR